MRNEVAHRNGVGPGSAVTDHEAQKVVGTGERDKRPSSRNDVNCQALRNGNSATCLNCAGPITPKRGSRRQRFCCDRCRDEARRSRNNAICGRARYPSGPVPRSVENSRDNSSTCNGGFGGRASARRRAIQVEIIDAHAWTRVTSHDGVAGWLTRLRPRALRERIGDPP